MNTFKYLLKQTPIIFVYLVVTMITAVAVVMIEAKNLLWLRIILWILNVGLFAFIIFLMTSKAGEDGYKLKHTNDIKRRVIMQTGEYYEFKTAGEYGKWKGLYIGLLTCVPLVFLALLEFIMWLFGLTQTVTSTIAIIIYGTFLVPLRAIDTAVSIYVFLYAIIPICIITHFGYTYGVRKIKKQYDKIKKTNEAIYGKNPKKVKK